MRRSKSITTQPKTMDEVAVMWAIAETGGVTFVDTRILTADEAGKAGEKPVVHTHTTARTLETYRLEENKRSSPDTIFKMLSVTQAEILLFAEKHGVEFAQHPAPPAFRSRARGNYSGLLFGYDDTGKVATNTEYVVPPNCPQHVSKRDAKSGPAMDAMDLWRYCEDLKEEWRGACKTGKTLAFEVVAMNAYTIGYQWAMIQGIEEHAAAAEKGHWGHKRHGDVARETHRKSNRILKRVVKPDAELLADALKKMDGKPATFHLSDAAKIIAKRDGFTYRVIYRKILAARKAQGKA